jgi:hypothetical protein
MSKLSRRVAVMWAGISLSCACILAVQVAWSCQLKKTWSVDDSFTVTINQPQYGAKFPCGAEVACSGSATDKDRWTTEDGGGGTADDSIAWYAWEKNGGTWKNGVSGGANVTWIAPDTAGLYAITLTADDVDGRPPGDEGSRDDAVGSKSVAVTVDATPPTCELTAPQDGAWLKKGHPPSGNGDEIALRATASDPETGIIKVAFYVSQDYVNWSLKGEDTASPYEAMWDTDYSNTGVWYVMAVAWNGAGMTGSDVHTITLFHIDLQTNGLRWLEGNVQVITVADSEEDSPGAFIHYNKDNDNGNVDDEGNPIADCTETGPVNGENDTIHMIMTIDPLPTSGSIVLSRGNSNAKVWSASDKGADRGVLVGSSSRTWNMADPSDRANYQACAGALWAEGCGDGSSTLTLTLKDPGGGTVGWDALLHTYIAALCGRQPKPAERTSLSGSFPKLVHCEWSITGEATDAYNCIAWSVGETSWRYHPVASVPGTNIIGIDQEYGNHNSVFELDSDLDPFYQTKTGYTPTASGPSDAQVMYYSGYHAARRKGCSDGAGKWIMYESKCGDAERIEHLYDQLDGSTYGSRVRYYK